MATAVDYTLTVQIDQHWVGQFNSKNMKLCFAAAIESGPINYNVVAYTTTVAATVTITWHDAFFIAASKDSFSNGAKFVAATTVQPIGFGQTYELPKDWSDKKPNPDVNAPSGGFRFHNNTEASAVVYKKVNGNISPIYISAAGPLPPGHEDLTPKAACRIWFAANAETQTMVSDYASNPMDIDLTGSTSATVKYDATGTWINV